MTSLLSCVVATLALGTDPDMKGLPFGIPPAQDDAVIAHVAPPHCLFYVNWAGTTSPNPASASETEKMLAEPEVQGFLSALSKAFAAYQRQADEATKKSDREELPPHGSPSPAAHEAKFRIWNEDIGDFLGMLLTHPAALFVENAKFPAPKPAVDKPAAINWSDAEIRAGIVVGLGPDASQLRAKLLAILNQNQAHIAGIDTKLERIKIAGETWYRTKSLTPNDRNVLTLGFHGKYFVAGIGKGAVEGILARWNRPAPAWYDKALAQTPVPRRTGIVYLNVKMLCKSLPWPSKLQEAIVCKYVGLDNVNSLISTTGLDKDGMINRVLLALDGEPHGLLNLLVADSALAAKDLGPIPSDALFAIAARVDLERSFNALIAAYDRAIPKSREDRRETRSDQGEPLDCPAARFVLLARRRLVRL